MADISPFRGVRYDLGRVGTLADVIAPPYDVIDPPLQDALYARNPFNVVRLILNKELPGDDERDNRYVRAARFLRDWQRDGVLSQDSARSLYVYHQDFEVEGRRFTRKGVLARVRLEPLGTGRIYAHEETLAGPKADRLKLFRATQMNLSPVFGLYPDADGAVQEILDRAVARSLPLEASDHLGVVSRLWPVSDQHVLSQATGLFGPRPVFIADGHHRYETGLKYLDECRASGEAVGDDAAPNFILMMLVSMSDPGLIIMPTHRLVSGLAHLNAEQVQKLLASHFEVTLVGHGDAAARQCWEQVQAGGQEMLGFGAVGDGSWLTARFLRPEAMSALVPQHSDAWRRLAVAVLHVLVLDRLARGAFKAQPTCRYVHLLREVTDAAAKRECQLAVLVPPATMGDVEQIAGNREKMPPKSTYFYPKLLSGLVFNPLKGTR